MRYGIKEYCLSIAVVLTTVMSVMLSSCDEATLPTISIEKESAIAWGVKQSCTINYTHNTDTSILPAAIKCRGGVSSKYFKHSFSLELESKYPLGDFNADDDWVLNASYIDKTFMRHKISYDLFRQMSPSNIASKCSYVNVELNKANLGLYVLMEEINGSMLGVDKTDSLGMVFKDPPIFYEKRTSFFQDSTNYYQQKYPRKNESDKTYYIEEFKDFLFHSSDDNFIKGIGEWIDIQSVIDWHILLLFTNNCDGIMKNFILYKLNSYTPFRISVWDYDHSFGRDGDNALNMMEVELDCSRSVLLDRLMQIEETGYSSRLKDRWFELRGLNIISSNNIQKMIHQNDRLIRSSIDINAKRWPFDAKWYHDSNNYDEELDLIGDFVDLRINQLDAYFD